MSRIGVTERQAAVLTVIEDEVAAERPSPNTVELARACGFSTGEIARILDALRPGNLHLLHVENNRMPTKLLHRDFEADPCPGRTLVKHHRQRQPFKNLRRRKLLSLQRMRLLQNPLERLRPDIRQIDKMSGSLSHCPIPFPSKSSR